MSVDLAAQELAVQQKLDRIECGASPITFTQRHVTIETPTGEAIPFALWPFQEQTLRAIHDDGQVIVLKARRLGLSWLALAYSLWLAIFQQGSRVLILCKNEGDASELLDRVRRMRDRLLIDPASAHLLVGLGRPSKSRDKVTTLDVGESVIRALVATESSARQETAAMVVLDEFAFAGAAQGIWRAVLPTIEGGGRLIAISTGNGTTGKGEEFANQWSRAVSGESGFTHLFWPWDAHPHRDAEWKVQAEAQLGDPERFKVEYPESPEDAFLRPDALLAFDTSAIDAAVELGRRFDEMRERGELPPPVDERLLMGVDWGDFATHALIGWELERGGMYIPPAEVTASRTDVEDVTEMLLKAIGVYPFWFGEERFDASKPESNRTFRRVAEQHLGRHNPQLRKGRPKTYAVVFGTKGKERTKPLAVRYIRLLLRRTLAGETTRVLAISPTNEVLIEQLRAYEQDQFDTFKKGNDDGVDALIALMGPPSRKNRKSVDKELEELDRRAAEEAKRLAALSAPPGSTDRVELGG